MPKKSSAYYQRQYRERLRSQGLVKKEVWILPDFTKTLSSVETILRDEDTATNFQSNLNKIAGNPSIKKLWTTQTLFNALCKAQSQAQEQKKVNEIKQSLQTSQLQFIDVKFIENTLVSTGSNKDTKIVDEVEPIIHLIMRDFGDLPIFLTVQGEQIIAETILCTVDEITDVSSFNDLVLRTHKFFPLSTVSLDTLIMSSGEAYDAYQIFGSLSATANLQEIILEIEMLASNVMQALEAYSECFKNPI